MPIYWGFFQAVFNSHGLRLTGFRMKIHTRYLPWHIPLPRRYIAEQLDAHRKARQALYSRLTLTGMYNVLETVRNGQELSAKEQRVCEEGDIVRLGELHDALDVAVGEVYGG